MNYLYHPQTDGLVDCFNRTFKAVLRKMLKGMKRDRNSILWLEELLGRQRVHKVAYEAYRLQSV